MLTQNIERKILSFSIISAFLFALTGSIWGILINSQIILFDGIYSFLSVILSAISLLASEIIKKEDDKMFQFGRSQVEPITIVFKSLIIISICVYAFVNAINSLFEGGRSVSSPSAILYSVFTTLACLICWLYVHKAKKKIRNSGLLKIESKEWLMDTLLSSAVLIGFIFSYYVEKTSYSNLVVYFDPLMVIIVTLFFLKLPILDLINNIKELLLMAPDDELVENINNIVALVRDKYSFDDFLLRTAKRGRIISIEVNFISHNPDLKLSMYELDLIREDLELILERGIKYEQWLTITFMNNEKWA